MFELVWDTFIKIEVVLTQMLKGNQNLVGARDPVGTSATPCQHCHEKKIYNPASYVSNIRFAYLFILFI